MDSDVEADELAHRICGARELGEEASVPLAAETPSLVALGHPGDGPDPLRHPFLRRPRAAPLQAAARFRRGRRSPLDRPEIALAEHGRDELELSFPTIKHLEELSRISRCRCGHRRGAPRQGDHPRSGVGQLRGPAAGDPGFADKSPRILRFASGPVSPPPMLRLRPAEIICGRLMPSLSGGTAPCPLTRARRVSRAVLLELVAHPAEEEAGVLEGELELVAVQLTQVPVEVELAVGGAEVDLAVDRRRPSRKPGPKSSRSAIGS